MLNLFEDLKIDDKKLHQKYKIIRDNLFYTGEQEILKDWVTGFEDRDNKIVKEFQTSFHSSFWEFYLFAVFKEAGFKIDFTKNRPDFIIEDPCKIYVEAVVANIKKDGLQEEKRNMNDILSMIEPSYLQENFNEKLRESITRYSSAILSKNKKHKEYSGGQGYDKNAPYVIALSGYEQINYGNNFYHAILALLYGLYYDNLNDKYDLAESIIKPDTNSDIPIGLFSNRDMAHISAIIFSSTLTLGKLTSLAISQDKSTIKTNFVLCIRHDTDPPHFKPQIISPDTPEYLSDGLFVLHNPFADNPLPKDLFKNTNAINISVDIDQGIKTFDGNNLPIVSRLNLFSGEKFIKNSIYEITQAFNPDLLFIFAEVIDIELGDDNKIDVIFKDLDSDHKFTLEFTDERFKEYMVAKEKKFLLTFKLNKDPEIAIKTVEQFKIYQAMRKLRFLILDQGYLIDIKNID